jgi:hypothetical protein
MKAMTRAARQLLARMLMNDSTEIELSAYGRGGTDLKFNDAADYEKFLEAMKVPDVNTADDGMKALSEEKDFSKR